MFVTLITDFLIINASSLSKLRESNYTALIDHREDLNEKYQTLRHVISLFLNYR